MIGLVQRLHFSGSKKICNSLRLVDHPSLSVIIPAFNHGKTLPMCLESIFRQTKKADEILVIDDGSTDNTKDQLEPYLDRISYIHQENTGAPSARNNGFQHSKGDYVIFCDADVEMKPNMLEKMYEALEAHPEMSFAYAGFVFGWKTFKGLPFSKSRLFQQNFIHTTTLIRRMHFPGFDEQIKRLQDWDLWLTMVKENRIGICVSEKPLFIVHVDGASRIGSTWLPKFLYSLPWKYLGWAPAKVQRYLDARNTLSLKHKEIVPL